MSRFFLLQCKRTLAMLPRVLLGLAVVAAVAPQVISKTSVQSHTLYRILMFPDFCFRTEGSKDQGHIAVEEAEALQVAIEHLTTSPPNN